MATPVRRKLHYWYPLTVRVLSLGMALRAGELLLVSTLLAGVASARLPRTPLDKLLVEDMHGGEQALEDQYSIVTPKGFR